MTDLVDYVVRGIPIGCVFALMAVGIVLTYKTSGVLNLAFAAQAFASAAVFYDVRARHDWPLVPAFVLAVVVVGPLIGLLLDRLLFRHLRTASPIAKLVVSLGLLVALPEIIKLWFGKGTAYNPPSVSPDPDAILRFGDYALDANEIATVVLTVVSVVALTLLFRYSAIGLKMRAVVESPRMTELNGINADRVGSFAWMLSSFFAGLAGVLLAPLFAQVEPNSFFTLLVAALAAAAFGKMSSIPLTFLGGILLGVAQQTLAGTLPRDSILATGLRPSLPFIALILLLLFWPGLRQGRPVADPLAGVDPPPPAPAAVDRTRGLTLLTRVVALTAAAVFLVVSMTVLDDFWLGRMQTAVILGIIFLSITVVTGMGGIVSLCQATFAAVGGFATAQLVDRAGLDVLTAALVGALIAAAVGALVAIPALRLRGIYLALVTLAFAIMFENILVPQDWVSGGIRSLRVPRPTIGPIDFEDQRAFLLLCIVCLAIVSVLVVLIRSGTTGRFLDALRGSETAALSIGINPVRSTFLVFAISAGLAGFGGGLLATQQKLVNYQSNYYFFFGLVWVVLVVTMGARSVQAAITAGFAFVLMPELFDAIGVSPEIAIVLFGLGALTYARHPEGIVEAQTRRALAGIGRLTRGGDRPESESGRPPPTGAVDRLTTPISTGGAP
jgi:branched-subunit amino acid ABC-type transport system permease component